MAGGFDQVAAVKAMQFLGAQAGRDRRLAQLAKQEVKKATVSMHVAGEARRQAEQKIETLLALLKEIHDGAWTADKDLAQRLADAIGIPRAE
jgi:hypothetical protein